MPQPYQKKDLLQLRAKLKTRPDTSRGFSEERWTCRICRAAENEPWRDTCWRCNACRTTEQEDDGRNVVLDKMIEQNKVKQWLSDKLNGG